MTSIPRLRLLSGLSAALALAVLVAVWGTLVLAAQDKYTLQLPNGLPFSDFKGYEDWQVVSVSRLMNCSSDGGKSVMSTPTRPVFPATAGRFRTALKLQRSSGN